MANASAKKQAAVNKAQLRVLHNVSYFIYASTFIFFKVAHHSIWWNFFFAIPGICAELVFDSWCRPRLGPKDELISAGLSVNQPGLVDYVKDMMILNWFILLLSVCIGLKAWFSLLVVPGFLGYKAFQLLKAGKQLFSGGSAQPNTAQQNAANAKKRN